MVAHDTIRLAAHLGQVDQAYRFYPGQTNPDGRSDGEWYFVLVDTQGTEIGVSESYVSKSNAQRGMETVMGYIGQAIVDDWTDLCAHSIEEIDGHFNASLTTPDWSAAIIKGGLASEPSAKEHIRRVLEFGAEPTNYVVVPMEDGNFYYRLEPVDGEILMESPTRTQPLKTPPTRPSRSAKSTRAKRGAPCSGRASPAGEMEDAKRALRGPETGSNCRNCANRASSIRHFTQLSAARRRLHG